MAEDTADHKLAGQNQIKVLLWFHHLDQPSLATDSALKKQNSFGLIHEKCAYIMYIASPSVLLR